MAIHDSNNRLSPVKTTNLRICCFYLDWLMINKNIQPRGVNYQDGDSCRHAVNQLINQYYSDKARQTRLLEEMDAACDENVLPQSGFDWLNKDERAAFWLWAYICKTPDYKIGMLPSVDAEAGKNGYQSLQLSYSPADHQERISLIFNFFDEIIIPTPPVNHLKKQALERLKDKWKAICSKPLPLKWLPDEEEAVLWAWNNLQKLQLEKSPVSNSYGFDFSAPGLTTWFIPLSHTERCLALRAALDLWDNAPDTKRLFLLNLNKAWNQQKLRQSRTDKKALNTYLKNDTKMKLDELAAHYGIRISDVLEKLINAHHRETLSDK